MRPGALSRFTILDATRVRAGPTAVRTFADLGARVIKLEIPPGAPGGDDMIGGRDHNRADYENLHRNKESLTLNMKEPEGIAILHELVRRADVFVENYRPDVKHRLGIAPEALRAINLAWSTRASPASARTGPMPSGRVSTRSPKAWAG